MMMARRVFFLIAWAVVGGSAGMAAPVIEGLAVDPAGKPVAGAEVRASDHHAELGRGETDEDGHFAIELVRPHAGRLQLHARLDLLGVFGVDLASSFSQVRLELQPVVRIEGVIQAPPAAGALDRLAIKLFGAGPREHYNIEPDPYPISADGRFQFHLQRIEPGRFAYFNPAPVVVGDGDWGGVGPRLSRLIREDQVTSTTIQLERLVGGSLRLLDRHGQPVAGLRVHGYVPLGLGSVRRGDFSPYQFEETTDADGRLQFTGALPRQHTLFIRGERYIGFKEFAPGDTGDESTLMLDTIDDLSYSGRVQDGQGRPLADMLVGFGLFDGYQTEFKYTSTDADGRYAIDGLPMPVRSITFFHPEMGEYWIGGGDNDPYEPSQLEVTLDMQAVGRQYESSHISPQRGGRAQVRLIRRPEPTGHEQMWLEAWRQHVKPTQEQDQER